MGKVLNNPKSYFDNLSDEDFEELLNKFDFKYTKVKPGEGEVFINGENIRDIDLFYKLLLYFQDIIINILDYDDKELILTQIDLRYLKDAEKIIKLLTFRKGIMDNIFKELLYGYKYMEVVKKGKEEDSIKYSEMVNTIIDIFNSIQEYIDEDNKNNK